MAFLLRIALFLLIFVSGIYIGIHIAEENMHQLHGMEGAPKAIQITPQKDGKVEISVLGQVVEAENKTEDYQKQVHQITKQIANETNQWSDLGNTIGNTVSQTARNLLGWLFAWMH
jgi:hypothetical protein